MTLACILRHQSDERQVPGSTPGYNKVSIDNTSKPFDPTFFYFPEFLEGSTKALLKFSFIYYPNMPMPWRPSVLRPDIRFDVELCIA